MDLLANVDLGELAMELETLQLSSEFYMAASVTAIVSGLLIGVLGLKLVRFFSAMTGFCIGAGIGLVAGVLLNLPDKAVLGTTIGGAVVFAILFGIFKKIGMFIWIFTSVMGVFGIAAIEKGIIWLIVGAAVGLIIAILSVKFFEPLVIIATSMVGGSSIASGVSMFAGLQSKLILNLVASAVAIAVCVMIQFAMQSRKLKKKEKIIIQEKE